MLSTGRSPNRVSRLLVYLATTTLYGVAIEILQQFTGREFNEEAKSIIG